MYIYIELYIVCIYMYVIFFCKNVLSEKVQIFHSYLLQRADLPVLNLHQPAGA